MLEWCRRALPCALAVALGASPACEQDETRPGLTADCNDPACLDARGDSFPLPAGAGNSGAAGAAGSSGMPGGDAELTGSVLEVASQDLVSTQSLRGDVEVHAESAGGGDDAVAEPSADGSYRLDGIERGAVWVGVGDFGDAIVEPYITTLQVVDSGRAGVTDLVVLQRDVLRDLAASSFLNQTAQLADEGAHLVIRFVDSMRRPVEGVQITFPSPDDIPTAYDAGDTYSDAFPETSTRGMAVLLNLAAPRWPGTSLSIVADIDGDQLSAEVHIARGAVSVVTAVVPDP